jgi:ABC-type molybdate transport system substrate-binding protein
MTTRPDMPTIPDSRADDLHGLDRLAVSQLNLFMAGNQFMLMDELVAAFKQAHPDIRHIYCQTLPPGLQLRQILAGGARFGNRIIPGAADIYTSVSESAMVTLADAGKIDAHSHRLYLHNRLVLLVPLGNPKQIETISDLGQDPVRISQPDPIHEDIAFHIVDMYRQAGGEGLVKRIMDDKRAMGTTIMTVVHHRETPLRLEKGTVDVGPVWATEALHARSEQLAVDVIDPGPELDQRQFINYYICRLNAAPNPGNADRFLAFMASDLARNIYTRHGFIPHNHK